MEKYVTTKEECQKNIDSKKVCPFCGEKLSPIETVDNAGNPTFWSGCESCQRYTVGVKKKLFLIARKLVENDIIIPYENIDRTDVNEEYWINAQTGGLSSTIGRIENMLLEEKRKENE